MKASAPRQHLRSPLRSHPSDDRIGSQRIPADRIPACALLGSLVSRAGRAQKAPRRSRRRAESPRGGQKITSALASLARGSPLARSHRKGAPSAGKTDAARRHSAATAATAPESGARRQQARRRRRRRRARPFARFPRRRLSVCLNSALPPADTRRNSAIESSESWAGASLRIGLSGAADEPARGRRRIIIRPLRAAPSVGGPVGVPFQLAARRRRPNSGARNAPADRASRRPISGGRLACSARSCEPPERRRRPSRAINFYVRPAPPPALCALGSLRSGRPRSAGRNGNCVVEYVRRRAGLICARQGGGACKWSADRPAG